MNSIMWTRCVVCQKRIDDKATVCPYCTSFQRTWKNETKYYASITGLVVFSLAVAGFVFERMVDVYKWFTWEDGIAIVALESMNSAIFTNVGDGEIVFSAVILSSDDPDYTMIIPVNKEVERGHSVEVDTGAHQNASFRNWEYVSDVSDAEWDAARKIEHSGYHPKYFNPTNAVLATTKEELGDGIRTFPCSIEMKYLSSRYEGEKTAPSPREDNCRGLLLRPPDSEGE